MKSEALEDISAGLGSQEAPSEVVSEVGTKDTPVEEDVPGDGSSSEAASLGCVPAAACCVCLERERLHNCIQSEKICILPILACLLSLALCTAGLKWVFVDKIFEYEPPTHPDLKHIKQDPIISSDPSPNPVSPEVFVEGVITARTFEVLSPRAAVFTPTPALNIHTNSVSSPRKPSWNDVLIQSQTVESNEIILKTSATSTTPSAKTSSHVTRCGESERNYCVNGGECFTLEVTAGNVRRLCRCPNEFTGDRCQNYVMASFYKHLGIEFMEAEELYQKRVLTITGICIALLVVGIMCVVAYCKTKKQRKKLHDRLRQNLRERNVAAKASGQTPQEHLQLRGHCPKDAVPLEKEAETALSSSPTCPTAAITPSNSQCWRAGKAEAHCPETHVVVVKPVAAGHRTRLNGTGGAHRDRDPAEPVHSLSFAPRVATPPLTPSSPPSESSAPLSSLATSVLSEAVSPSGEEERPLLIQTPVLRAKPGSNQGQKSERSLHLRNSAHYNHGLDAPTPPASPEPAEESGNPSIPPAGQAEPSSESSSSESEEDEDTPFLVLQNPLLASSGSVVLDGLEGRTNPTRSRLNPVMAAADPIAV